MSDLIGVLENLSFHPTTYKNLSLMFDQIAIPGGWETLNHHEQIWPQFDYREQRLLFQLGVLLDPYADPDQPQYAYDEKRLSVAHEYHGSHYATTKPIADTLTTKIVRLEEFIKELAGENM